MACFIILLGLYIMNVSVQGRSMGSSTVEPPASVWSPDGMSRSDWLECHGLPCDEYVQAQETIEQIFVAMSGLNDGDDLADAGTQFDPPFQVYPQMNNGTLDGCIMLTPDQANWILDQNQETETLAATEHTSDTNSRVKRKITDFDKHPYLKWTTNPIVYKFDGKHTESERELIRGAFSHWMEKTCVQFREAPLDEDVQENHVLLTNEANGCYSYVGMVPYSPQQINLQDACLWEFGVAVHEIGHTLGLWHEQMRFDRDDYIRVLEENLGYYQGQFARIDDTASLGVRYDYASVMHYSPKDGSANGQNVIEALDPLYQSSMGQRTGLSFADAHIINNAYCADVCWLQLARPCENNGYQDPKQCDRCRCPEGLSGQYCEEVAPPQNADCGAEIQLSGYGADVIMSPGYDTVGYYENQQECNWLIKAPAGFHVSLRFFDAFSLYCHHQGECHHWVEVRYNGYLGETGPRFCCQNTPDVELVSLGQDMLVVFRANWTAAFPNSRRGFQALVTAVPGDGVAAATTTTSTTTTTTTAPPTTTTTAPTTTTTPTTTTQTTTTTTSATTTTAKSGSFRWWCDFEDPSGRADWCGMEQEVWRDQFDWMLWTGSTPSQETGPTSADSGMFYIFIEASNPRKRNDEALIRLPSLAVEGLHCMRFKYHMFGFHINELQFIQERAEVTDILWSERKQQGTQWLSAHVSLELMPGDRLGFIGIRGGEFSGDIALDAIELTDGMCEDNALFDIPFEP